MGSTSITTLWMGIYLKLGLGMYKGQPQLLKFYRSDQEITRITCQCLWSLQITFYIHIYSIKEYTCALLGPRTEGTCR